MSGRRRNWVLICRDRAYGPFLHDGEAAIYLLHTHTGGLLDKCDQGVKTKQHAIVQMQKEVLSGN